MPARRSYTPLPLSLLVKRSIAGLGLYAGEQIPNNACIIEYVGRAISKEEELTSRSRYLFSVARDLTIDGTDRTNKARYINHSCKPNSEPIVYKRQVFVFAIKSIKEGEEITYDYGKEYFKEYLSGGRCRCGASKHLYGG